VKHCLPRSGPGIDRVESSVVGTQVDDPVIVRRLAPDLRADLVGPSRLGGLTGHGLTGDEKDCEREEGSDHEELPKCECGDLRIRRTRQKG